MLFFYLQKLEDETERTRFADLYETYQQKMYWLAYRYLQNEALAEECVNDAFLELIKSFEAFSTVEREKQPYYLYTITERCAFKKYRQEKRQAELPLLHGDLISEDFSPGEDTALSLGQALQKLPEAYQYPLLLRYAQDQTYEEIAALLGISVANARQRVKRGRDKLVTILQEVEVPHA